jgi:hypothetical protein
MSSFEIANGQVDTIKSAPRCDGCEQNAPNVFCSICNAHYCSNCDKNAHQTKNTRQHDRVALASGSSSRLCQVHVGTKAELFCFDCKNTVCILCRDYGLHKGHRIDTFVNAAPVLREELRSRVSKAEGVIDESERLKAHLADSIGALDSASSEAIENIEDAFAGIARLLHERRDVVLAQIDELGARKVSQLNGQAESLRALTSYSKSVTDAATSLIKQPPTDICYKFASTSAAMKAILDGSKPSAETVEDACVPVYMDPNLEASIKVYGSVGGPTNVHFFGDPATGIADICWSDDPTGAKWLPEAYRVRVQVVRITGTSASRYFRTRHIYEGYETIINDRVAAGVGFTGEYSIRLNTQSFAGSVLVCQVQSYDNRGRCSSWISGPAALKLPSVFVAKTFVCKEPFDENGLLYWLGSREGTAPYTNPLSIGAVGVNSSGVGNGSAPLSFFVSNIAIYGESCFTEISENAWMGVDIGAGRLLCPSAYCLRHDTQSSRGVLRNWILEGRSTDQSGDGWVTLSTHRDDESLALNPGSVALFQINSDSLDAYRYFRIVITGPNSSGKLRLMCSGFEIYGSLY